MPGYAFEDSSNEGDETEETAVEDDDDDTEETEAFAWLERLVKYKTRFEEHPSDWNALEYHKFQMSKMEPIRGSSDSKNVWNFRKLTRILGPDASRLLWALAVKINNREMLKGRKIQLLASLYHMCPGNLVEEDWEGMKHWTTFQWKTIAGPLEEVAPKYGKNQDQKGWVKEFFGPPEVVKVDVYWCGLKFQADMVEFLQFLVALSDCPDEDIFETPVGQAMCQAAWMWNTTGYWTRRVVDMITVTLLIVVGLHSRVSHMEDDRLDKSLHWFPAYSLTLVNAINLAFCIIEVRACWDVYGNVRHVAQSFTVINWCMEFGIFVMCLNLNFNDSTRWIRNHPLQVAGLIIVKWLQVLKKMISVDFLIDSALPAWSAITSKASGSFMTFLFWSIGGTIFAYFSLPRSTWTCNAKYPPLFNSTALGEYYDDVRWAISNAIGLTLLSDFDMDGIEGRTKTFKVGNATSGGRFPDIHMHFEGEVPDLHNDMPVLVLANAFLFAVLILNLYIGILSDEYSTAKGKLMELKCRHRINASLPNLLIWYWLRNHHIQVPGRHFLGGFEDGFWIAVPKGNSTGGAGNDGTRSEVIGTVPGDSSPPNQAPGSPFMNPRRVAT